MIPFAGVVTFGPCRALPLAIILHQDGTLGEIAITASMVTIGEQTATRREKARLRSERWRRAHGIMPRKPASKPWLAEGCSRSTWYRRGNRVPSNAEHQVISNSKHVCLLPPSWGTLSRAVAFTRQLQAELAEVARCQAIEAAIIGELMVSRRDQRVGFS
jgi:hypothetical protein